MNERNERYVLAIDQSTQGTKAILFDARGNLVCRTDLPHRQIVNDRGWVSHDLNEIYDNTIQVVRNLLEKAKVDPAAIACVGISNQRETSAAWDRQSGKPLADAIVWQCSRAEDVCDRIRKNVILEKSNENVESAVRKKTGINLSAYFPAAKYTWLLENVPQVKAARGDNRLCFGTIDSYLVYRLTNGEVYATDYSNASRTQLLNITTLKWDEDLCRWFGIGLAELPEIKDSDGDFGTTDFDGVLPDKVPICGVMGDSQAALFGQGCTKEGMVKATYGTGSSVMMNAGDADKRSDKGLVTSLAWGRSGRVQYVLEGNINYTGAVITWLKDDVELISSPAETEELARGANPNDTAYLVPAFTGLGAPYWKPHAKALLYGMSRTTGKKEIVKAGLESIAYQIADIVFAMQAQTKGSLELRADGGPTGNRYLMQFQSDIVHADVRLAKCQESSALGAAYMAGLKYGIYQWDVLFADTQQVIYHPQMEETLRREKYDGWKQAIAASVNS